MKKLLTLIIAITVILAMSISASADPGAFVQSPSANGAPELVEEDSDNVIVTAYRDREDVLSEDQVADFEDAYKSVVSVDNLTELVDALSSVASNVNVPIKDLAVNDLFFVSLESGEAAPDGASFKVKLKADTLDKFVCLMVHVDGEWMIVENVVLEDGEAISFDATELGAYAVVVSTGDAPEYPEVPGGDDGVSPWVVVGVVTGSLAVAAGAALIVVLVVKSKSKKESEE